MPVRLCVFLAIVSLPLLPPAISAQDTHYWTQQYGTRAELLSGTVVGSLLDLSAVFYNPGALALQKDPSFLIGTKAFEYQTLKFDSADGRDTPVQTRSFGPAPSLFAGLFPQSWLEGRLAYSGLTRQDFDFRIQTVNDAGDLPGAPGDVEHGGVETYIDQNMTGIWGGVTWSRDFGGVGVGVTPYIAYHGQRTRYQLIAQGITSTGEGVNLTLINEYDFWNVRAVFKAGVAFDYEPLTFGLTVTTPGLDLFGQGSALMNVFANGLDLDGDNNPDTEVVANYQKDRDAIWKSAPSIAAGASYSINNTTVHGTVEWFGEVEHYQVMQTEVFDSPTTGETYEHIVDHALDSVLNWGLGLERHLSSGVTLYGSYVKDNSAYAGADKSSVSVSTWDLHHVMGGAAFRVAGTDFTLGVGYAFGKAPVDRPFTSNNVNGTSIADGPAIDGEVRYQKWKIILGFAFGS